MSQKTCFSCDALPLDFVQAKKKAGKAPSADLDAGSSGEIPPAVCDGLFSPADYEYYLELSRRPKATACSFCGAEAEEGGKKLQVCSRCHFKSYCSAACQRMDWKESGHKETCRHRKDFRQGDVVVAEGVEGDPKLNGKLMVVV